MGISKRIMFDRKIFFSIFLFSLLLTLGVVYACDVRRGTHVEGCWDRDYGECCGWIFRGFLLDLLGDKKACAVNGPSICPYPYIDYQTYSSALTNKCPSGGSDGATCEIQTGWNCDKSFTGKWDASENKCIECTNGLETKIYGDSSSIYTDQGGINGNNQCESGCSDVNQRCDEKSPGSFLNSCEYGKTYFADKCSESCNLEDEKICRSSYYASDCTGSTECDGTTPDSNVAGGYCDSNCKFVKSFSIMATTDCTDAGGICKSSPSVCYSGSGDCEFGYTQCTGCCCFPPPTTTTTLPCNMDPTQVYWCGNTCRPNYRYLYCVCDAGYSVCNKNRYYCSNSATNDGWPTYDCLSAVTTSTTRTTTTTVKTTTTIPTVNQCGGSCGSGETPVCCCWDTYGGGHYWIRNECPQGTQYRKEDPTTCNGISTCSNYCSSIGYNVGTINGDACCCKSVTMITTSTITTTVPPTIPTNCQILSNKYDVSWNAKCGDSNWDRAADVNRDRVIDVLDKRLIESNKYNDAWCSEKLNQPDPCVLLRVEAKIDLDNPPSLSGLAITLDSETKSTDGGSVTFYYPSLGNHKIQVPSNFGLREFSHFWDKDCDNNYKGWYLDTGGITVSSKKEYNFEMYDKDRTIAANYKVLTGILNLNYDGARITGKLLDEKNGPIKNETCLHLACSDPSSCPNKINPNKNVKLYYKDGSTWHYINSIESSTDGSFNYDWVCPTGATRIKAEYIPSSENWFYNYSNIEKDISCGAVITSTTTTIETCLGIISCDGCVTHGCKWCRRLGNCYSSSDCDSYCQPDSCIDSSANCRFISTTTAATTIATTMQSSSTTVRPTTTTMATSSIPVTTTVPPGAENCCADGDEDGDGKANGADPDCQNNVNLNSGTNSVCWWTEWYNYSINSDYSSGWFICPSGYFVTSVEIEQYTERNFDFFYIYDKDNTMRYKGSGPDGRKIVDMSSYKTDRVKFRLTSDGSVVDDGVKVNSIVCSPTVVTTSVATTTSRVTTTAPTTVITSSTVATTTIITTSIGTTTIAYTTTAASTTTLKTTTTATREFISTSFTCGAMTSGYRCQFSYINNLANEDAYVLFLTSDVDGNILSCATLIKATRGSGTVEPIFLCPKIKGIYGINWMAYRESDTELKSPIKGAWSKPGETKMVECR